MLHQQGYTIAGAKKLISETDDPASIKIEKKQTEIYSDLLTAIKDELLELKSLLDRGD